MLTRRRERLGGTKALGGSVYNSSTIRMMLDPIASTSAVLGRCNCSRPVKERVRGSSPALPHLSPGRHCKAASRPPSQSPRRPSMRPWVSPAACSSQARLPVFLWAVIVFKPVDATYRHPFRETR